eukprot:309298-Rhodomonas_salina.1
MTSPAADARRCWVRYVGQTGADGLAYPALVTNLPTPHELSAMHKSVVWLDGDDSVKHVPSDAVLRDMTSTECDFVDECWATCKHGGFDLTMLECEELIRLQ